MKPIVKNKKKSLSSSDNYRSISLNSLICKIMELILLELLQKFVNTNKLQFGFKEQHSTVLCSFALSETIQYYINQDSNIFALFLDSTKAFDLIKHDKLFECLIKRNICSVLVRFIMVMYLDSKCMIQWNSHLSPEFALSNGVKQGGVLSPFLFGIYMDPLLEKIQKSGLGCHIGNSAYNILSYADDVVILAPTVHALNCLLNICKEYAKIFCVKFNSDKSKLMVFSKYKYAAPKLYINDKLIEVVSNFEHLGSSVVSNGDIFSVDDIIKKFKIKCNVINNEFKCLDTFSRISLFNSHCLSLYGCPLWNLKSCKIERFTTEWRKCCRLIMRVSNRTHNNLIPLIMNTPSLVNIIHERFINFVIIGIGRKNDQINTLFKGALLGCYSFLNKNINIVLGRNNMQYNILFENRKVRIKEKHYPDILWKKDIIFELMHMRDNELFDLLSKQEIHVMLNDLCAK